jgi:DNA (cytosine-5)-methyltransferase 1
VNAYRAGTTPGRHAASAGTCGCGARAGGPRIGSLCTGYGGLDLAVELVLGGRLAWYAETDPHAQTVLAHHWPDVANLGDIRTVDWTGVEPVEILTAGFPCQDYSE